MPKQMNTAYFQTRYYTAKEMCAILECQLHQLRAAMQHVSFPSSDLQVGITRFWLKESAEAYFPQLRGYLSTSYRDRKQDELIADIRAFIDEHGYDHADGRIFSVGRQYLLWTKTKCSERTIARYGGWMVLVMKAIKEM